MSAPDPRIPGLEALLREAEAAHGVFEATELNGVYDQDWPAWYARYVVDHGLGSLLGEPVDAGALGRFLAASWADLKGSDPDRTVPWAVAMAPRIAERWS